MGLASGTRFAGKRVVCNATQQQGDLGVHTSYSCLSHVDIGLQYNWYPGVNAAVWRGGSDKHCVLCKLEGNSSSWTFADSAGDVSYARYPGAAVKTIDQYDDWTWPAAEGEDEGRGTDPDEGDDDDDGDGDEDDDGDGPGDDDDDWKHKLEKQRLLEYNATCSEWNAVMPHLLYAGKSQVELTDLSMNVSRGAGAGAGAGGTGLKYVLKSWNFGANWTWIEMPDFLQGAGGFVADPTNDTLYTVAGSCISRSCDQAETWSPCWDAPGLVGSFRQLVIRDSRTMLVVRNGDVPLRTTDGGASWHPLASLANVARYGIGAAHSWSGKTLAISGVAGLLFVWVSGDDGDTWVDETGDYTSMSGGIAQWYDNTLYICSLGQGISSKTCDES